MNKLPATTTAAPLPLLLQLLLLFGFCVHPALQQSTVYTHSEALGRLNAAGISVTSSGQCSNRGNAQCTSLDGIHSQAIDGVITLKQASGCPIIVTGGTETGHESVGRRSHHNGWKLDIRKRGDDCITRYITGTFTRISPRRWRAASGNVYLDESNHWDIQYGNNVRDKRTVLPPTPAMESSSSQQEEELPKQEQKQAEEELDTSMDHGRHRRSTDQCLRCICQVESGCRPLGCSWDVNSLSCGYFQIKKDYYVDCRSPGRQSGESLESAWRRCANDYDCAARCIQNYVSRFGHKCGGVGPCQRMARLHNGGPNGCRKSATNPYWAKVYNCLP